MCLIGSPALALPKENAGVANWFFGAGAGVVGATAAEAGAAGVGAGTGGVATGGGGACCASEIVPAKTSSEQPKPKCFIRFISENLPGDTISPPRHDEKHIFVRFS